MSTEYIWETFDSLFKTVHRRAVGGGFGARVVELERRCRSARLSRAAEPKQFGQVSEMPTERAA